MSFAFVQSNQNSVASGTTVDVTPTRTLVAGELVVVTIKMANVAGSAPTVTDNAAVPNTYALAVGPIDKTNRIYQFYGVQVTGGATFVRISWTGSVATRVTVDVFTGGKSTNAAVFDQATSNTGSAGTSASVASFAPSSTGNLIVAGLTFLTSAGTITAGTNYRMGSTNTSSSTENRLSSAGAETAPISWTSSSDWAEVVGSYKAAPTTTGGFFSLT